MQRAVGTTAGDCHLQGLLAPTRRAEVGQRLVQADQPQQALDEPRGLAEGHAEEDLHGQTDLDGGVTIDGVVGRACLSV